MKNKTVALCMIVKNESHIILETLNSVKKYLDYWVICDTGSTDNTVELIKDFFAKEKIPGEIHTVEWKNFGHNRSQVFEFAHKKADYLWVIDADDIIVGDLNLSHLSADSYSLRYGKGFTYLRSQIFNGAHKWMYKGVLHEYPVCLTKENPSAGTIEGEYYIDSRRLGARNLGDPKVKYLKDARVFEEALNVETDTELINRYLFYLAQSYRDADEYELAIKWYLKRIEAKGWAEEVWFSKYQIGKMYNLLGDFNNARLSFLDAFEYRPTRAESLYSLGKMCNEKGDYFQAEMVLDYASKIPETKDVLFVSKSVYDYEIDFELSIALYWVGEYQRSLELCDRLIAMKDEITPSLYEQTVKNRVFSLDKSQKK